MPGYFEDEATTRERPLLQGKSYASEFYHYKEDGSGKTVYDNWEPEIEDRIDTQCAEVPYIPAGHLSQTSLGPLTNLEKEVQRLGTMVFTDVAPNVSSVNRRNLREALDNMVADRLTSRKFRLLNDNMRTDGSNPDTQPCRARCTKIARRILRELGVPNADKFVVCSVRCVIGRAEQYHRDRLGFGPSVLVIVLASNSAYKVKFARMKSGGRAPSDMDSDSDTPLAVRAARGTYSHNTLRTPLQLVPPPRPPPPPVRTKHMHLPPKADVVLPCLLFPP